MKIRVSEMVTGLLNITESSEGRMGTGTKVSEP